jgi:hypothetical protein
MEQQDQHQVDILLVEVEVINLVQVEQVEVEMMDKLVLLIQVVDQVEDQVLQAVQVEVV